MNKDLRAIRVAAWELFDQALRDPRVHLDDPERTFDSAADYGPYVNGRDERPRPSPVAGRGRGGEDHVRTRPLRTLALPPTTRGRHRARR